ncbi:MAG: M23 family metallopeptidase [Cellulomonadaceae bacterium]
MNALTPLRRHSTRVLFAGMAAATTGIVLDLLSLTPPGVHLVLVFGGLVVVLVGLALTFWPGPDSAAPARVVHAPVCGRWTALNSPATKVPSHGVRSYGQAYAIDVIYDPEGTWRATAGRGRSFRPAADFTSFGRPVLAPVSGTVVGVHDGARDHRARNTLLALPYFTLESIVRELGGVGRILGNHVIIDAGDGSFAVLAHLQRGSTSVRVGEVVDAGQEVGRCGNSGNSTEPHLHMHLMDRAAPAAAQGVPMAWADVQVAGGEPADGLPGNFESVEAASVSEPDPA